MILINGKFKDHEENEWLGIISTLKHYINDNVVENVKTTLK